MALADEELIVTEVDPYTKCPTDGRSPRTPLCGWMLKRKSDGSRSRVFCASNRRYFTLDFGAQILYYAQSEANKSVSVPIGFRDLLGVEPFGPATVSSEGVAEEEEAPVGAVRSNGSKQSAGSGFKLPTLPSLGGLVKRGGDEKHGFVLRTRGKSMELLCASASEAESWMEAIHEAMSIAGVPSGSLDNVPKAEPSTAPGSSRVTSASPEDGSPRSGDGEEGRKPCCITPPRLTAEHSAGLASTTSSLALGLDKIEDANVPTGASDPPPHSAGRDSAWAVSDNDSGPARRPSSAAGGGPTEAVTAMKHSSSPRCDDSAWGANTVGEGSPAAARSRYADKGQGLTMQQRLSQLDFSDDEDEEIQTATAAAACADVGEAGGVSSSSTPVPQKAREDWTSDAATLTTDGKATETAPVTIDVCETFSPEDADSDED
eukprot:TRINITY_DN42231_c0_g1_i1.p1 TRINITY_DN42231_c0_g1~~TRINITY_DN42231_c0_g1_i1.p1  ORF type:complete len:451 (-),score=87.90 TRINITY_DN42231_c0_g1_i1:42-1337(-)